MNLPIKEQRQYVEGQHFISGKLVECMIANGLLIRPRLSWDNDAVTMVIGQHRLTLATDTGTINIVIEHEWLMDAANTFPLYRHVLEDAVTQLVQHIAQTK